MLFNFANVLVFLIFAVAFGVIAIVVARALAPRIPTAEKGTPYECGEMPEGSPWIRFNPRYYRIALIFIIFDVEIAFMYPCAAVFRDWVSRGEGWFALVEIFLFMLILIVGLVYAWRKGDLEWTRSLERVHVDSASSVGSKAGKTEAS